MIERSASVARRRALIVDSDPEFARSLDEEFQTRGFLVETAASAEAAIERVAAAAPDLVVLHLCLAPDGSALKLLRLWKTEAPTLVVILVSGNSSLPDVVDALKEGARGFFNKPVSARMLVDEFEERQDKGHLSPLVVADHRLGTAALNAEGVDRFFAISPGLLSVAGFDGYFKLLNPAWQKVLGYSVDELCAKPYLDLVHPDDRDKATDEALEIRGGHTVFCYKNRYRCKDGSYRWLSWSATPCAPHRLIYASARDVTSTVRMEQGLRQSNKQLKELVAQSTVKNDKMIELGRFKDEVAAMIVHDLKNPLAVIVSNYEYLLDGFEGSADCLGALKDSQEAGQRMLRLLANLVDVARLENGTLDVSASPVLLVALLQSVAEQRRVLARSLHIAIIVRAGPEIEIAVDADLVTRMVENILDNAMRYTPSGGSIEIEQRNVGADVEIRIGNSGSAIPPTMRATLFDKHREPDHADSGHMNLGLGLYFCRLAIEAHGGEIWVEETERLPTVIGIRLPRVAPAVAALPKPDQAHV